VRPVGSYCTDNNRQCTYSVILKRVRVTIVAVEKRKVLHVMSVCIITYPECKAHALHYNVY